MSKTTLYANRHDWVVFFCDAKNPLTPIALSPLLTSQILTQNVGTITAATLNAATVDDALLGAAA